MKNPSRKHVLNQAFAEVGMGLCGGHNHLHRIVRRGNDFYASLYFHTDDNGEYSACGVNTAGAERRFFKITVKEVASIPEDES